MWYLGTVRRLVSKECRLWIGSYGDNVLAGSSQTEPVTTWMHYIIMRLNLIQKSTGSQWRSCKIFRATALVSRMTYCMFGATLNCTESIWCWLLDVAGAGNAVFSDWLECTARRLCYHPSCISAVLCSRQIGSRPESLCCEFFVCFGFCLLPSTKEEVHVFARVCLCVCLLAKLLKNVCMDLDEMLCVGRCRDMPWMTD